ncbi:hypothetical protein HB904_03810 [Listeria booriae]|uniref:Uncharacterized protein n=1 Tax=Listeria booriae TaxID=1552123 RepID=A0A842ADA5_9LIST|nr:hypothetical protein [Listeria booriae]MBC1615297.1 hypothetical protein [Listeria booriae]MBC1913071.1 hypothetical protein [Listeria booriae]
MGASKEIEYVTQKEFQKHKARINKRVNGLESVVHELRISSAETNALLTSIEVNTRETKDVVKEQAADQKEMNQKLNEQEIKLVKIEGGKEEKTTLISAKAKIIAATLTLIGILVPIIYACATAIANVFFN